MSNKVAKMTWHVMPINDLREHIDNKSCWCRPFLDDSEEDIYIHNSMDRREEYEQGRKFS